jgi:hypothetical protein
MSRGLGRVQRALLAALQDHDQNATPQQAAEGMTTFALTCRVYPYGRHWPAPWLLPQAEASAVRRTLAGLAREGLVIRLGSMRDAQCRWRRGLRRPP